ncbi:MAG: YkgJ family cysteine cluster protein [Thermodesulfobacteriota bacterium]|jgi:Fe-S-cluster containining protein|nr:MAG: YkgJ family cysteine cluster protein [Thermodesulfobacteriota bacterium]
MNEEYGEKRLMLSPEGEFKFLCHNELSCFNVCCADVNIFLTPYDVLRMKKAMGLSSGEFLKDYTIPLLGDEGLPLVVLKMREDENKQCPFVTPCGCEIYEDRPWACRMYPLFPASSEKEEFLMGKKLSCLGFKEEKQWTIDEWKKAQGIEIYDIMNESYKEITHHDYFLKANKLDPGRSKLLYTACYDLDEFKKFLFETRFFDIYDVEREIIERVKEDGEELLSFGYRWVRFNLFGEDTLRLKDKVFDKVLQAKRKF